MLNCEALLIGEKHKENLLRLKCEYRKTLVDISLNVYLDQVGEFV